jgi:hypothetical protein
MPRTLHRHGARGLLAATVLTTLTLAACGGGGSPFDAGPSRTTPAPIATGSAPAPTPTGPQVAPLPTTPAAAPAPAGGPTTPGTVDQHGKPTDLAGRIAADKTAMLNVRTMVSVIEGCHSGRTSYRDCNTHEELGSSELLGLEIGKKIGQVQISATTNGFRITARSLSGAKFTVARGPKGDRFKCLAGPHPGACPENRTWAW